MHVRSRRQPGVGGASASVGRSPALYTSTWNYDPLDRVQVFEPALRDVAAKQARYALYDTVYTYDEPSHDDGIGWLTSVSNAGLGTFSYDYDLEGGVTGETRDLHVAPDGITMTAGGTITRPTTR